MPFAFSPQPQAYTRSDMTRAFPSWLLLLTVLFSCGWSAAERVADLPIPSRYVNDFAQILTPDGAQQVENLCLAVHRQANAEIAVVTIKQLEDGQSLEDFTAKLEEKWKLGKAGEDRSVIFLIVMNPHGLRLEIGYGLEGILNDARAGAILDQVRPLARQGDFDQAALIGVQDLADVIAKDAGVTLQPVVRQPRQQPVPAHIGAGQIVLGIGLLIVFLVLVRTGHIGWAWVLLSVFFNGGGRGGGGGWGGGDDEGGGGFGGVGGGGSGGGGASRDF